LDEENIRNMHAGLALAQFQSGFVVAVERQGRATMCTCGKRVCNEYDEKECNEYDLTTVHCC